MEKQWKQWEFICLGCKITSDGDCSHEIKRCLFLGRKTMTNLHSILKSRNITLPTKVHIVKAMVSPVVMYGCEWELDHNESWALKNWCFWTVVLEKTLENPLDHKEIQPVHPKGNQSCIFIGRTIAEAEAPILWPPDVKNWLTKKTDAGQDWRQEEKGMTGYACWRPSPTQWILVWASSESWWCWEAWCAAVHGVTKSWTWLDKWTELEKAYGGLKFKLLVAGWNVNNTSDLIFSERTEFLSFFKLLLLRF